MVSSLFCEVEIVHREEVEADLPDDVTASCYDHQITTQVLFCVNFDALCVFGMQSVYSVARINWPLQYHSSH